MCYIVVISGILILKNIRGFDLFLSCSYVVQRICQSLLQHGAGHIRIFDVRVGTESSGFRDSVTGSIIDETALLDAVKVRFQYTFCSPTPAAPGIFCACAGCGCCHPPGVGRDEQRGDGSEPRQLNVQVCLIGYVSALPKRAALLPTSSQLASIDKRPVLVSSTVFVGDPERHRT